MKKFLSLVLALIMVMSLVTVGAGATFTDAEEITNTEAVEVMSALGILGGYTNGSFDPTGTITRGAAAKIITYMLEGTVKAEAMKATGVKESSFSDVPVTSSNAAFIEYCAQKGIVGGYDDGTFRRSATLTGQAFLKMILKALGDTTIDFNSTTNPGWPVDATELAVKMELIDEDTFVASANLSREDACQIAFNAMNYTADGATIYTVVNKTDATEVYEFPTQDEAVLYLALLGTTNYKLGVPETDKSSSLAVKNYKLESDTIIIKSNQATVVDQETTIATDSTTGKAYSVETGLDMIGHKVEVFYKDANGNRVYDAKEEVYTVVDLSKVVTVAAEQKKLETEEVEALLGIDITTDGTIKASYRINNYVVRTNSANTVTYASEEYTVPAGTYVIADKAILAVKSETSYVDTFTVTLTNADKGEYNVKDGSADTVVVVDEDEELCEDYDLTNVDWAGMVTEEEPSAVAVYLVTKVGDGYTFADVKTATGKVTKAEDNTSDNTKDAIYVNGTKVLVSGESLTPEIDALEIAPFSFGTINFKDEFTFYLDQDGKVFGFVNNDDDTPIASDASVIIPTLVYSKTSEIKQVKDEYGNDTVAASKVGKYYSVWTQGVTLTGEVVELQVLATTKYTEDSTVTTAVNTTYAVTAKTVYTYTTLKDSTTKEDIATLTQVDVAANDATKNTVQDQVAAGDVPAATDKKVTVGANNYYLNDTFKVIYIKNSGAKMEVVIKDGTVDQIVENAYIYGTKASTENTQNYEIKYVVINGEPAGETVDGQDLIFVKTAFGTTAKVPYTKADGTIGDAYEQTVYINGVKTTIVTLDEDDVAGADVVAGFYTYTVDELGIYTLTATNEGVVENDRIDSIYKTMITINTVMDDADAAAAKIVDLRTGSGITKITEASKLTTSVDLYMVWDAEANTVSLIYIV